MKILMILPPSPFLLDDRVFVALGPLSVVAALENAGHDVCVEDLSGLDDVSNRLVKRIQDGWDCYLITGTTPQWPTVIELLTVIRQHDPGKRVVVGGPHATVMPESCSMFDCVVRGDGEEAIIQAIRSDAPHLIDASNVVKGELRYIRPARHLVDMNSYRYTLQGLKGTSAMFSTGCPYNCSFCCMRSIPTGRRVRVRDVDDVVREIEHLQA